MRPFLATRFRRLIATIGLCAATSVAIADPTDPHLLYEKSCGGCHAPHAGKFVFESLDLAPQGLVGRKSGRSVQMMLEAGHGRVSPSEINAIMTHLSSIQQSGRVFQDKCSICHVRAVDLARHDLFLREGTLFGRYSGVEIATFLLRHGRLSAKEVAPMVEVLKRQLRPE